jgi:cellulose synthase/poly-beta-1,6-N-acetylglucosamine synthase-like glycosyltransferase
VVVPGEVPINIVDFKNQQSRWAVGSLQCARRLMGELWRSGHLTLHQKLESTLHLTNYLIFPFMMMNIILLVLLLILNSSPSPLFQSPFSILFSIGALGASTLYSSTVVLQGMSLREKLPYLGLLAAVGVGLSAHLTISMLKSLFSKRLEFKTTPKYNLDGGRKEISGMVRPIWRMILPEIVMALVVALGIILAIKNQILPALSTLFIYLIGYSTIIFYSKPERNNNRKI